MTTQLARSHHDARRVCVTTADRLISGFSVLESLVATALAGMIALSVMTMMAFSIDAGSASEELTALTARAVGQLEGLNALPFGSAGLRQGGALDTSVEGYSVDPVDGDPNVYLRWEIEDVDLNLKRISIVAGYRSSSMGRRRLEMETFRVLSQ